MAVPSNRTSSSPIPGLPNPNARSSEIGNPMRRSFTGNPFGKPSIVANPKGLNPNTPANSPSELPRRNSVSRESVVTLRNNEDKENGKMEKLRSPMESKGSGTKNFMSPTISAASKINASPRKRILEERNELVRASVSFSNLKIASFDHAISDSSDHKEEEEEILPASLVSADMKAKLDSKPKKVVFLEPEIVNLEPSFKISPSHPRSYSPSIPTIMTLESDPLAPPYDPKTNYLSPRPQFLHYKPNQRVELYLSKKKEGKRLEDSFASGSFSDSDVTEEEEQTQSVSLLKEPEDDESSGEEVRAAEEEEQQEEEEEPIVSEDSFASGSFSVSDVTEEEEQTQSVSLLKEPQDDESSSEEVRAAEEEEQQEEEEEPIVSEPSPIDAVVSDEIVEAKCESTPRLPWRSKLTALLIVLSIICVLISVANSPVIDYYVFDGPPAFLEQYDHSSVLEFAKSSFDGIAQRFRVWYANSISSFSELIFNLRGEHKVEPLHYFNLTALVEDGHSSFDDFKINVSVSTREKRDFLTGTAEIIVEDKELQIDGSEIEETPEIHFSPDCAEVGQAPSAEVLELESPVPEKSQEENDLSGHLGYDPVPISLVDEAQPEVSEAVSQDKVDVSPGADEMKATKENSFGSETPEVVALSAGSKGSEAVDVAVDKSTEDSFCKVNVLGIALLLLAIIASTGFVFVKIGIAPTLKASDVGQGFVTKKLDSSPIHSKLENTFEVKPSSWDCSGESCPSETSSYQNTSSYNNNNMKKALNSLDDEAQSDERKTRKNQMKIRKIQRKESMASTSVDSSMCSPSYGSFTTYEKIPTKYENGDEEGITPVRRSSRLRSHVTSP